MLLYVFLSYIVTFMGATGAPTARPDLQSGLFHSKATRIALGWPFPLEERDMNTPYRLKKTLGSAYNPDQDDVWVTKHNLKQRGYYSEPRYGMTEHPDQQLFDSIKRYQRDNRLIVDGIMKPGGETETHLLSGDKVAMTYWCSVCGAPHGGVNSPGICWQCWNKGYR